MIGIKPGDLITELLIRHVERDEDGFFVHNEDIDICKLAVIERHKGLGNVGLGLVEGFQLHGGAIATTIAHDSHNIIVLGDNDIDIVLAVEELIRWRRRHDRLGGGRNPGNPPPSDRRPHVNGFGRTGGKETCGTQSTCRGTSWGSIPQSTPS